MQKINKDVQQWKTTDITHLELYCKPTFLLVIIFVFLLGIIWFVTTIFANGN